MAISTLGGVNDANVYVVGYFPTGADVGSDFTLLIAKINETLTEVNANTGLAATALATNDAQATSITDNADDIDENAIEIAALDGRINNIEGFGSAIQHESSGDFTLEYADGPTVICDDSTIQRVLLDDPDFGSWNEGDIRTIVCDNDAGIHVASLTHWNNPPAGVVDVGLRPGQVMHLRVVGSGGSELWEYSISHTTTLTEYITLVANRTLNLREKDMIVQGDSSSDVLLPAITAAVYGHKVTITRNVITFNILPTGNDLFLATASGTITPSAFDTVVFIATNTASGTGGYKWIVQWNTHDQP